VSAPKTIDMKFKKFSPLNNDVIIVDGLWGSGKSMLAPIIGGMSMVEKHKLNPIYEYMCCLNEVGKMSDDACVALLKTYADMDQYHNVIGREVNFRWTDDSGVRNNPNTLRYISRLFGGEGEVYIDMINDNNIALFLMTHNIMLTSGLLYESFGDRLKLIQMVRHPVYLFEHWYTYLSRFDSTREFTLSFDDDGYKIPWFWKDCPSDYKELAIGDKVIRSMILLYNLLFDSIGELNKKDVRFLVVSFESLAMDTKNILKKIEDYLERPHSEKIDKILKKQKLPREQLSKGKGLLNYGWRKSKRNSDKEDYNDYLEFIRKNTSESTLNEFDVLIARYNKEWPSILSQFHK
jgi:hypothetical protein